MKGMSFAVVLLSATLVGLVISSYVDFRNAVYADDNTTRDSDNASDQGNESEETLPVAEYPLYPSECSVIIHTWNDGTSDLKILVLHDGLERTIYLENTPRQALRFKLRNDGWSYASAQFFEQKQDNAFTSAIILVPDEESLKLWNDWWARQLEKAEAPPKRKQPQRVLPPSR